MRDHGGLMISVPQFTIYISIFLGVRR
jgi:hypothetical protein